MDHVSNLPSDDAPSNAKEVFHSGNISNDIEDEMEQKDLIPEVADKKDSDHSGSPGFQLQKSTLHDLTTGLLSLYLKDLKKVSSDLSELKKNQNIIIETIEQENAKFAESRAVCNLEDLFARAKLYHMKLSKIKKDMATLHEQSRKLKKRALRLQEHKQKEALQKEYQREREVEREKQLVAKVASQAE